MIAHAFKELKKLKNEEKGQTSVEVILLIGAVLVITIISGTYVYDINAKINAQFYETSNNARSFLLNKL